MAPALYAAFDRYPAAKGAAVHIGHAASTLLTAAGGGLLAVLGDENQPRYQLETLSPTSDGMPVPVEIVRSAAAVAEPSLTRRTDRFAADIRNLLDRHGAGLRVAQFRDPWSGVPVLTHPDRTCPTVYEVNGLPSIEWPARYPAIPVRVVARLRELEQLCWSRADVIVTPGPTMATNLARLGAPEDRLHVIPNGATVASRQARPPGAPERYIIYVGALQPWQGVDVALRALACLADDPQLSDVQLVVCAAAKAKQARPLRRLAARLGVTDRVSWRHQVPHPQVQAWLQHAAISLAPLTDSARNVTQGCAPLKVVESLAAGTPVVASDLPVTRDVVDHRVHGLLVPPDRPRSLARAIRLLLEDPAWARAMGAAGRDLVATSLNWERAAASHRRIIDRWLVGSPPGLGSSPLMTSSLGGAP
jgi:glycosyltransferase involved in cell wall biosynthesis